MMAEETRAERQVYIYQEVIVVVNQIVHSCIIIFKLFLNWLILIIINLANLTPTFLMVWISLHFKVHLGSHSALYNNLSPCCFYAATPSRIIFVALGSFTVTVPVISTVPLESLHTVEHTANGRCGSMDSTCTLAVILSPTNKGAFGVSNGVGRHSNLKLLGLRDEDRINAWKLCSHYSRKKAAIKPVNGTVERGSYPPISTPWTTQRPNIDFLA